MLGPTPPPPFDPAPLRRTVDLTRAEVRPTTAEYHRVRRGVWMRRPVWEALSADDQHAAFVHATALCCDPEHPPTFSHTSAAALWGLPRVESWPRRTDALVAHRRVRSSVLVVKHVGAPVVPVRRAGLLVTPAARTVCDLARTASFATGLAAADHALRHGLCTGGELVAEVEALTSGAPGRARAARVAELADAASMSAGESLSRARMFAAGIPRPELQHRVDDDDGLVGFADFRWGDVVGEFDGRVKYRVPDGAPADRAGEVLWGEKRREDRFRRRGYDVARWVWHQAYDGAPMVRVLARVGVVPDHRASWFDLGRATA